MAEPREPAPTHPRLTTWMSSRARTAALSLFAAAAANAQTHHVAPPEKVTRAVAVYEYTGDLDKPTAARLVPVSLFINGHFEDAGLYLARPVPFALESGDIYSVEQAGDEKGTVTLKHAFDFTAGRLLTDQDPIGAWYGFGPFKPLEAPKPAAALHASAHPPVIVASSDPDRPHLATKTGSTPAAGSGTTPAANDKAAKPDTPVAAPSTTPPMGDDPDRPTLGRRTSTTDNSSDSSNSTGTATTSSNTKPSTTTDTDPERPSLRKRSPENTGRKSPPTSGVTGPDRPLNDDPDRPIIRHGKAPAEEEAEELKTLPADMRQIAAVSDPSRREPHLFTRDWDSQAERAAVLTRLQTLARAQAAAYLAVNHLNPGIPTPPLPTPATTADQHPGAPPVTAPPSRVGSAAPADSNAPTLRRTPGGVSTATPASSTPATPPTTTAAKPATPIPAPRRTSTAKRRTTKSAKPTAAPAPLLLTGEHLSGYLLTYGGLPTFAYTAQVPVTVGGPVYVTLLAQRLPSGELQITLKSVTDASHLDRTPWMRPIDAVDPDDSHRASLLFELRAQTSRQFALYRLISAQADQQFLSEPIQ